MPILSPNALDEIDRAGGRPSPVVLAEQNSACHMSAMGVTRQLDGEQPNFRLARLTCRGLTLRAKAG